MYYVLSSRAVNVADIVITVEADWGAFGVVA